MGEIVKMAGKARKSTKIKKASSSALARRQKAAPAKKKRVEIDETKHYAISEIGPICLEWGKKRVKNNKGKVVKEYYLKKNPKHRIWVKWEEPFQDRLEDDNNGGECKWSAEPQIVFEGGAKKLIKDVLEKKVVWPWIEPGEEDAERRKTILKSKGFKEWKNPNAKGKTKWQMRYTIAAKTDTSGQSGSDSDGTSSTTDKEGEDDEDDEV